MLSALSAAAGLATSCSSPPKQQGGLPPVDVELEPAPTQVDLGGVSVRTWAYGGAVPGREIRLRKGQTLRAAVTNRLPQPTTVHWHGLAIANDMDGVPVLTQPPIAPGQGFHYEFAVPDAGTYWYHSHVGTQLDRALYGPLIIEDPNERVDYDDEIVVVLDDWIDGTGTGTDPDQVLANLKKTGMSGMGDMPADGGVTPSTPIGLDGGDVTYPYFLANGRVPANPQVVEYRTAPRIRLRVINAGADTAFRVAVPGATLTVTHTDGYPVVPQQTAAVILGMGERFDATVTVSSSVPVIAAAEGKDGHAQLNLRVGGVGPATNVDDFIKTLRATAPLNTAMLVAAPEVQLPQRNPDNTLDVRLAGPVNGYNWPINGKLYDPLGQGLAVTKGQRVRVRLINESKMFHPIHLHGHTFQVLAAAGPAARKDTVLVAPLQTVEFDFDANNPGSWITHCHNDYHLESGMATFIRYS